MDRWKYCKTKEEADQDPRYRTADWSEITWEGPGWYWISYEKRRYSPKDCFNYVHEAIPAHKRVDILLEDFIEAVEELRNARTKAKQSLTGVIDA
jgi:hypothetical protein